MDKDLRIQTKNTIDNAVQKYLDDQILIIIQKIERKEEKLVDFKEFKAYVKSQIKAEALKTLDISSLEASKRNIRETYMYRDYLDNIYKTYIEADHVNPFQDLVMNALNEMRGGCTTSLKGETEETISAIQDSMAKIEDFNKKIQLATSETEKQKIEAEKATYMQTFDESMKGRTKQDKTIVRPSEALRPMNPAGKNRTYSLESSIINAIYVYVKKEQEKNPKIVVIENEKIVHHYDTKTEFITVPVDRPIEVPVEKPPKPKIEFDGTDGFYKLHIGDERKTFRPTLSGKNIKQFKKLIMHEYENEFPILSKMQYDPAKIIDVNIYGMLRMYDKTHGTDFKDAYVKDVIRLAHIEPDLSKETTFDVHYDLSNLRQNKNLGRGLTGLVRKHRIKNYADANGQDGIDLAKYTRDKKAKFGLRKTIHSKRGTITPERDVINIVPPTISDFEGR